MYAHKIIIAICLQNSTREQHYRLRETANNVSVLLAANVDYQLHCI